MSYVPPAPQFEVNAILELTKKTFGYELFGYWLFFSEDGADKVIEKHVSTLNLVNCYGSFTHFSSLQWDSFYSVLFPSDPGSWKTDLAPRGALKAYLEADKKGPLPPYVTEEVRLDIPLYLYYIYALELIIILAICRTNLVNHKPYSKTASQRL